MRGRIKTTIFQSIIISVVTTILFETKLLFDSSHIEISVSPPSINEEATHLTAVLKISNATGRNITKRNAFQSADPGRKQDAFQSVHPGKSWVYSAYIDTR